MNAVGGATLENFAIQDVADKTGLSKATIRFYDSEFGDFLNTRRDPSNKRIFSEDDIKQFTYIRQLLKKDGMSIRQVKERLRVECDLLKDGKSSPTDQKTLVLLQDRLSRVERQQDLLVKGVENMTREIKELRRSLDLNLATLSTILKALQK